MGRKLSPEEAELYRRCDEILHYIWDPCSVGGSAYARDEYWSYLPHVFQLVRGGAEPGEIADYLAEVQTEAMGLPPADRERLVFIAGRMLEWRDKLREDAP